jgi:hypothetical protein
MEGHMADEHMLDDLEFDRQIAVKPNRDLMEFIARQTYDISKTCGSLDKRLCALENQPGPSAKFIAGIGAAVGGTISGIVYGLIVLIRGEA